MQRPDDCYLVGTGETKVIRFGSQYNSLHTRYVGPCVSIVAYDGKHGAITHGWTDLWAEKDVWKAVKQIKRNFSPENTQILLIGGMTRDDEHNNRHEGFIGSSQEMVNHMKKALEYYGFSVQHEDLMGKHQRAITLDAKGTVLINDAWQKDTDDEGKYPVQLQLANPQIRQAMARQPDDFKRSNSPENSWQR